MILYAVAIVFDIAFFTLLGTRLVREIHAGRTRENRKEYPDADGKERRTLAGKGTGRL